MRAIIASGQPLAYCTHLYTDFPSYKGDPPTYVGNGQWLCNKRTHKKAGHCMMIIGYDDDRVYPPVPDNSVGLKGAVLIQNSFGTQMGRRRPRLDGLHDLSDHGGRIGDLH